MMLRMSIPLTIAALALVPAAQASTSRTSALQATENYMHLNCADGFDWACVDDEYLPPVCRDSGGHSAFFCTGAVREGTPNRITIVTVRVRKRDGDVLVRRQPGPRLGQDIVL